MGSILGFQACPRYSLFSLFLLIIVIGEQEQDHVLIELDIDILGLDERIVILKRKRFPFTGREEITWYFEAEKKQEGKKR